MNCSWLQYSYSKQRIGLSGFEDGMGWFGIMWRGLDKILAYALFTYVVERNVLCNYRNSYPYEVNGKLEPNQNVA